MKTRSVLMAFPGYPFAVQPLMPLTEAASVAAGLLAEGHDTTVWDCGTLDTMARTYPERFRMHAQAIVEGAPKTKMPGIMGAWSQRAQWRQARQEWEQRQAQLAQETAMAVAELVPLHFVGFFLASPADWSPLRTMAAVLHDRRPLMPLVLFGPLMLQGRSFAPPSKGPAFAVGSPYPETVLPQFAANLDHALAGLTSSGIVQNAEAILSPSGANPQRGLEAPAYEPAIYPALEGCGKFKVFTVEDSHGCACRCHVCPAAAYREGLRLKSPQQVCAELQRIAALFGIHAVHVAGGGTPASHAAAIALDVQARGMPLRYSRTLHAAYTPPAVHNVLRVSGCEAVEFQVDTGSQRLLDDVYGRRLQVSQLETTMQAARGAGLYTVARLTYPGPWDDRHTLAETLRLLERARVQAAPVAFPEVLRGSSWERCPETYGFAAAASRIPVWPSMRAAAIGEPPGYAVSRRTAQQQQVLREAIGQLGITTQVDAPLALAARVAGYEGREAAYSTQLEQSLFTGDFARAHDLLAEFHAGAGLAANLVRFMPVHSLRTAVGN